MADAEAYRATYVVAISYVRAYRATYVVAISYVRGLGVWLGLGLEFAKSPLKNMHQVAGFGVRRTYAALLYELAFMAAKNAPPLGSHVLQANVTIFKLIQDIIETNLLTKFHEDWTINVASRVLTKKNAPPSGDHKTHVLTKFHEDWTKNVTSRVFICFHCKHIGKTAPPPGDNNENNVLTKFHDDWATIVTSRVFTRNTAPPPGGHLHEDWASNVTSTVMTQFELSRGINGTNVLTKFHEDRTINEAS
ncbi:hypothetical protein DPMN_064155 [Dreissena polymorpha]|uniref:Uncharacterized protein n=1 Tax=Dreissena polymorpha TaxID=45954 RepID=A0A9D4HLV5_DREPO|nr:hypothetical protein DPMN_064155 [Dreissena polymorpha]